MLIAKLIIAYYICANLSPMESFELTVERETFKIIRNSSDSNTFNVFNHATCHVIQRNEAGKWKAIEHRFGADNPPLVEIIKAIEERCQFN